MFFASVSFSQTRDTVKVIMIVSDTTTYTVRGLSTYREGKVYESIITMPRHEGVYWQHGYEVQFTNQFGYMNWIEYLDINKKRITNIVWLTKKIN